MEFISGKYLKIEQRKRKQKIQYEKNTDIERGRESERRRF